MLVISHGQPSDRLPLLTATDEPWARIQVRPRADSPKDCSQFSVLSSLWKQAAFVRLFF